MLLQKLRQLFRRINNESGFTLVEFFVAIIIFSIIALSLFHALNLTLRVYKQEAYLVDNTPDITMISTIIHREIQNAVYMNEIWLIGGAREMYFFAPTSLIENDIPVSRITYRILENDRSQLDLTEADQICQRSIRSARMQSDPAQTNQM